MTTPKPSEDLFPIRELSQRCNVNTVTIRAWERRYGLLKPQRTAKGHRLYSEDDVTRVEQILAWMAKGVPVSRVKALLESKDQAPAEAYSDNWAQPIAQLIECTGTFSPANLQTLLHNYFLNYPAALCQEKLIEPTMSALLSQEGNLAGYHYLQSELILYALLRLSNANKKHNKASILLMCGVKTAMWRLALMAIELDDANIVVELINQPCEVDDWLDLAQANANKHCVVYQDGLWREPEIIRITTVISNLPTLSICGTAPMISGIGSDDRFYQSPRKFLEHFYKNNI